MNNVAATPGTSLADAAYYAAAVARRHDLGAVVASRALTPRVTHIETRSRDNRCGLFVVKTFADRDDGVVESTLLRVLGLHRPQFRGVLRVQELVAVDDENCVFSQVSRFEAGVHQGFDQLDGRTWGALGRGLATLHEVTQDPAHDLTLSQLALPDVVNTLSLVDIDATAARIEHQRRRLFGRGSVDDAYFGQRQRLLRQHACAAAAAPDVERQVLHNDYTVRNHLFAPGLPPLLLDFDCAARGPPEYEVVRCLNHLPLVAPHSAADFLDGYCAHRRLRRDVVEWAISAALMAHALKHWPAEGVARGGSEAAALVPLLRGSAELVAVLVAVGGDCGDGLRTFFDRWTS